MYCAVMGIENKTPMIICWLLKVRKLKKIYCFKSDKVFHILQIPS